MPCLIPDSDSRPWPADNVREAFPEPRPPARPPARPPGRPKPKPARKPPPKPTPAPAPPSEVEDVEYDEPPFEDEEERAPREEADEERVPRDPTAPPRREFVMRPPKKRGPPRPPVVKRPRRLVSEAEQAMDAYVERLVKEYTTASGRHVEIHSDKWHRCLGHVAGRKGGDRYNKYAVCTASIGKAGSLKKGHGGSA